MFKTILLAAFFIGVQFAFANDSLFIATNKTQFAKGDTLSVDCYLKYSTKEMAAVTLNVWIENIEKTNTWKYRYPLVNGRSSFDLVIHENLPDGRYAINFLVQPAFFSMKGKIRDYNAKTKGLVMMMLTRNKDAYIDNIVTDPNGNFKIGKLQFADTARFIFSSIGKKNSDLFIDLVTPLDSTFKPLLTYTQVITVGNPKLTTADTAKPYALDNKRFEGTFTLDEVIVRSTRKKLTERYDDEYVSGLFKGGRVFDGMEDNELMSATDIFMYLSGRVPGLQVRFGDDGGYVITRRGSEVDLYLDEFRMDASNPLFINPADVALIKVFDPNEGPGTGAGGSIAIYSKRGNYVQQNNNRKYSFIVKGFTPFSTVWK